ncbi:uncharacterized protein SOCE836_061040 [Sorangium cellulosum]|uniref:Uncharacterized protein n=1 Tax=Sorangium cellulosum TaxID=56 RepID=A0A4P2QU87_SORCE|nr:uncharacterized protein SOCE836_061040 [Sorangium cellulosum]WCQ93246.1 hypothetical protein NQZ70_05994 [Sorangium sp. Soce836]
MLAAVALAVLSFLIAAPVMLLLLVAWAAVLAVAGAGLLGATGGIEPRAVDAGIDITRAALSFTSGMALAGKLVEIWRRRSSAVARAWVPRAPWLLRHPFVGLGCVVLSVNLVLLPLAYAGVIAVPSPIRGAGVIGGAALLVLLVAGAVLAAWWRATRALWACARRSAFAAGVMTACGLVVALGACAVASAVAGSSSRSCAEKGADEGLSRGDRDRPPQQLRARSGEQPAPAFPARPTAAGRCGRRPARSGQGRGDQDETFTQAGRVLTRFHQAATFGRSLMRSSTFVIARHCMYGIHEMSASE